MDNLPPVILLRDMPVIIDQAGDYITRNGSRVTIHEITDNAATFSAKGAIHLMFRGKIRPRGYNGWHVSGRFNAVGPHPKDIVGKL